ncbi:hypothetical protein QWJ07_03895 [Frankia sp. RB7]|nr:hypothetical protein [Frankia sp. RB7]
MKLPAWLSFGPKKSKYEPEYVKAGSQRAKIIQAFIDGGWVGPYQACEIIGSHKGETRFGEVLRLLKRRGVNAPSREVKSGKTTFKQYRLEPWHRDAARELIVGKGA